MKWEHENNAKFNVEKFTHIRFNEKEETNEQFEINGVKIKQVEYVRDLGIIVNNKGTWDEQIAEVTKQSRKINGMIFRSFETREMFAMLTLLKSLILSKIDFGSVLWAPYKVEDLRKIERIQSNFTKRINIPGVDKPDYWTRLEKLNLYSIERRFERYQIIYMWKILHGLVLNPGIKFINEGSRLGVKCEVPKYTMQLREKSFHIKGPKLFNKLPKNLTEFPCKDKNDTKLSTKMFKKELDTFLKSFPDQPNLSGEYSRRMEGLDQNCIRTNSLLRIN